MKMNERGAIDMMLAAALVIVIVVGGFVLVRISESSDDSTSSSSGVASVESVLPEDLSTVKSVDEIQAQALAEAGDNTISGIELEFEDGSLVYVVHLSDGTVLSYDASTGESVTLTDDNDDDFEADSIPADTVFSVSIQDAIETAQAEFPESDVEKVEIEVEDGEVVYSVRFTNDNRVDVSVRDGSVLRVRDEAADTDTRANEDDDEDESRDDSSDDSDDVDEENRRSGSSSDEDSDIDEDDSDDNDDESDDDEDDGDDDEDEETN